MSRHRRDPIVVGLHQYRCARPFADEIDEREVVVDGPDQQMKGACAEIVGGHVGRADDQAGEPLAREAEAIMPSFVGIDALPRLGRLRKVSADFT